MALWMHVPLYPEDSMDDRDDSWEVWNSVRFLCEHNKKLGILLELGETLPDREGIERWWGEPVRAILIKTENFKSNGRGYPILSNEHVEFVIRAMQRGVQVVIDARSIWGDSSCVREEWPSISQLSSALPPSQIAPPPPPAAPIRTTNVVSDGDRQSLGVEAVRDYWGYISYLFRKQPPLDETEILEIPYRDFLQAPLQPLQDNLESQTYETFERDRPKYEGYQAAIECALREYKSCPIEEKIVLMVVGAGRGPLVAAAISASEAANRNVFIIAVEKNPNAVVHLHARAQAEGYV
jgi:protein arginine N-methyltransferase 5